MSTPRDRIKTLSVKDKQITITEKLLKEMGVGKDETFRVARVKRTKKVDKGTIVLTPASAKPRPWTDEEWRAAEAEADEDIRLGRVSGPFHSGEELIRHLREAAKKWR